MSFDNFDHDLFEASRHVSWIVDRAFSHSKPAQSLVIYDTESYLAPLLARAYCTHLQVDGIDFAQGSEFCIQSLNQLKKGDLAVLIQTSSFRLDAFRIRVQLFAKGIKVIEHPHLGMVQSNETQYYLDSIADDLEFWNRVGQSLYQVIGSAQRARILGPQTELNILGAFEEAKLNVGDYSNRKNWGGQFPIGEVFTEALDLETMSGQVALFAYGDAQFRVKFPDQAILLQVRNGKVVGALNSNTEFNQILDDIRLEEGEIWVREIGFGLNRALSREKVITGIGSFERMSGVHLSLGSKHLIYDKAQFRKRKTKYHVDVFVDAHEVYFDQNRVFENGSWFGESLIVGI